MATDAYAQSLSSELLQYGAPTISSPNTAPAISNVTPTANTVIGATQAIGFDVTDVDGAGTFRRILVALTLPDGSQQVIHSGDAFVFPYAGSTRTSITDGYRYSITREGGWPRGSTITLTPYAIDTSGDEAA